MDVALRLLGPAPAEPLRAAIAASGVGCTFEAGATAREIFEQAARAPLDEGLRSGSDWGCICYGPSCGGGSARTMFGEELGDPATQGLLPRCLRLAFAQASSSGVRQGDSSRHSSSRSECAVSMSAAYIHREEVSDLLTGQPRSLRVVDSSDGPYVKGLSVVYAATLEAAMDLLHVCWSRRAAAAADAAAAQQQSHEEQQGAEGGDARAHHGHTIVSLRCRLAPAGGAPTSSTFTFAELVRAEGSNGWHTDPRTHAIHAPCYCFLREEGGYGGSQKRAPGHRGAVSWLLAASPRPWPRPTAACSRWAPSWVGWR
eukprot:COSAG01_NODE_5986_length_3918_cov_3.255564_1_plen_314_part_00